MTTIFDVLSYYMMEDKIDSSKEFPENILEDKIDSSKEFAENVLEDKIDSSKEFPENIVLEDKIDCSKEVPENIVLEDKIDFSKEFPDKENKEVPENILEDRIDCSKEFPENIVFEFKEAFTFYDKDLTGKLATDKIGEVMRTLGQNPTEKELREIISEVDKNNTGSISFEVFINMMKCKLFTKDMEEELREAFRFFDKDRTGYVDIHQLRTALTTEGDRLEESEFEDILKDNEVTANDEIDYETFVNFVFSK